MNKTSHGPSETPDSELDLHQLHCRYAILRGADMREANQLWEVMKDRHADRGAHLAELAHLMESTADVPPDFGPEPESTTPAERLIDE